MLIPCRISSSGGPEIHYNSPDGKWTVVKRRTRLSMGKCAKCGETNHVTATCRHPDKVLCRQSGERGHKEKHHFRD